MELLSPGTSVNVHAESLHGWGRGQEMVTGMLLLLSRPRLYLLAEILLTIEQHLGEGEKKG